MFWRSFEVGALVAHARLTVASKEVLLIAKIDEGVQTLDRFNDYRATIAAVAPIGTAVFDILLAPEADASGATAARADVDFGEIEEFHWFAFNLVAPAITLLRCGSQAMPAIYSQFHALDIGFSTQRTGQKLFHMGVGEAML